MAKPATATKLPFAKTAFTPQALLAKLKTQGLIVNDDDIALKYIAYVGHFRLSSIGFNGTFKARLASMEERYGAAHFQRMGFPEFWKTDAKGW